MILFLWGSLFRLFVRSATFWIDPSIHSNQIKFKFKFKFKSIYESDNDSDDETKYDNESNSDEVEDDEESEDNSDDEDDDGDDDSNKPSEGIRTRTGRVMQRKIMMVRRWRTVVLLPWSTMRSQQ